MQFDPKMVEAVARAIREAPFHVFGRTPDPTVPMGESDLLRGAAALTALCAHLNLPPEALNALAAGEAVVIPAVGHWPPAMNVAFVDAVHAWQEGHVEVIPDGVMQRALAASPYAPKGGGDEQG